MTILIASTFFCQLFIAGLPMMLVLYGLALILSLSVLSYFFLDHVKNRIDSFLGNADTYQIDLSLMAFKSGGIFGKGPGQGDLKEKIPDANTDFIFAVAGEELGLIFCLIILILYGLSTFRTFNKVFITIDKIMIKIIKQKIKPNSSPATAKIKSVFASGIFSLRSP